MKKLIISALVLITYSCNSPKNVVHDYQIDVHNDTMMLYDGIRFVGKVITTPYSPLDSLITKDNQ